MGFGQDLESVFFDGETTEQERLRKQQEANLTRGYSAGAAGLENQYFGPQEDDLKNLKNLDALINGTMGVNITPAERAEFQRQRDALVNKIESTSGAIAYRPEMYQPVTGYGVQEYDVTGYEPTSMTATTEESLRGPREEYVPEFEKAAMQDPSVAALAKADAGGLAQQREAMGALSDVYKQGGLTAIDRARLDDIRKRNQMQDRAAQEAILADMERKGQSGSGVELAARLASGQSAADRMSSEGLNVAAMAQQRALEAMLGSGQLGQQLATDEFGRQYQTGAATDVVNQFNTLGNRGVQADQRASEQRYRDMLMAGVARDADRLTGASEVNTGRETGADAWRAQEQTNADAWYGGQKTAANQWGAETFNRANTGNVDLKNQAAIDAINQRRGNVAGWNQVQTGLGNLALNKVGAENAITAARPTNDYGAGVDKAIELGKTVAAGAMAL